MAVIARGEVAKDFHWHFWVSNPFQNGKFTITIFQLNISVCTQLSGTAGERWKLISKKNL